MTPAQVELARALVALPGWRWRAGMLAQCSGRLVRVVQWDGDAVAGTGARMLPSGAWVSAPVYCDDLPDLTDDATGGVLLGMLMAAALVDLNGMRGTVTLQLVVREEYYRGSTLAEAAARALVALGRCA